MGCSHVTARRYDIVSRNRDGAAGEVRDLIRVEPNLVVARAAVFQLHASGPAHHLIEVASDKRHVLRVGLVGAGRGQDVGWDGSNQ